MDPDQAGWAESKWRYLKVLLLSSLSSRRFVLWNIVVMYFFVLQVRWDEASSIPRPERVSPWQIEPAVSLPPINPLPVHRPKRPRSNAVASLPDSSVPTKEGSTLCPCHTVKTCSVVVNLANACVLPHSSPN